ncbi:MAG TPA: SDR family oxidoreductase [Candidatus Udaeobacter sp.]|nr:SDR family oxidoreductase [Candidatus Udaeobacter sp.]
MLIDSLKLGRPLDGQVALITGAGRGIGREAALALSSLGASIAIAELSETGRDTERAIRQRGSQAEFFQVDVSDPDAMTSLQQQLIGRFNRIDIVINNAVVFYVKPLTDYSVAEWDRLMAVNLRAAFLAAKLFVPPMVARGHGVFVTMQSGDGMPYLAPYFASKVALRSLASSLSQELGANSGVSVFCFGAGMVDTPAIREAVPRLAPLYGVSEDDFVKQSAPGGVLMTAEECGVGLAGCVLHAPELHGQEPAAVTGLALLGIGDGLWKRPDETAAPSPPVQAEDPAAAIESLVAGLKSEIQGLGTFQRQWYRRTLKQRSGLALDEWEAVCHEIKDNPSEAARYATDLKRLAGYFATLEKDARGYIRDPHELEQALAALELRRAAAEQAATSLAGSR